MDFGLVMTFSNPVGDIPCTYLAGSQIEQAVLAEELGYQHVWTAGHPGTRMYFPAQFPLLGAMAVKTSRIRLGTYIVALPLFHPLQVAEEAVTIDVISNGRFDLGIGAGNFLNDFEAYGTRREQRPGRMEDGLTIIRGLWGDEEFSYEGKYFRIPRGFKLHPRPVQKELPLWVAGTSEKAIDRAARFGAHFAATGTGFGYYESRLREYGYDPTTFSKAILQFVHLAETTEKAWQEVGDAVIRWLEYYKAELVEKHEDFESFTQLPGGAFGVDPLPDPSDIENMKKLNFLGSPFIIGDPQTAINWVSNARDMGVTHAAMSMQFGGLHPKLSESSMRLFAHEVIPAFAGEQSNPRSEGSTDA